MFQTVNDVANAEMPSIECGRPKMIKYDYGNDNDSEKFICDFSSVTVYSKTVTVSETVSSDKGIETIDNVKKSYWKSNKY